MNDSTKNTIIKSYVNDNLRPSKHQRDYVSEKYDELKSHLTSNVFRSGSFARHTAVQPIHDLDVIWVDESMSSVDNPQESLTALAEEILHFYESLGTDVPMIETQSHSVKIAFKDVEFSIDVVPAITADESVKNEFGHPIYMVPEIIKLNPHNRKEYYQSHSSDEIEWLFTDPRGYIQEAIDLDGETNKNYRATVRLLKSWRGRMKSKHDDDWKLKSFHIEQICVQLFQDDPDMTILMAAKTFYEKLPHYIINAPLIEDRAYSSNSKDKHIDEYMADPERVGVEQKSIVIKASHEAAVIISEITTAENTTSVIAGIKNLVDAKKPAISSAPVTYTSTPKAYLER